MEGQNIPFSALLIGQALAALPQEGQADRKRQHPGGGAAEPPRGGHEMGQLSDLEVSEGGAIIS